MICRAFVLSLLAVVGCDANYASQAAPSGSPKPSASPSASPSPSASASPSPSSTPKESPMPNEKLLDPAKCNETAPAEFQAKFDTSKGVVIIKVTRDWAPNGADRFFNLVKNGYFDGIRFFRVVQKPKPFMAQFGIHGDPKIAAKWSRNNIQDDPVKKSNTRGMITYAQTAAPNSRSTQLFINYGDNSFLDGQRFAPFGEVTEGMTVVDSFYSEYGEKTTQLQGQIVEQGNKFLEENFPKLDYIKTATILPAKGPTK